MDHAIPHAPLPRWLQAALPLLLAGLLAGPVGCFEYPDSPNDDDTGDDDTGDDDSGDDDTGDDDSGDDDTGPVDADGDGYTEDEDCDDGDASVHPGADEICDFVDNDCDGSVDENLAKEDHCLDLDGDTYGDPGVALSLCGTWGSYVADCTDCDDTDASVHPGATEQACNGIDDDCDGAQDPGDVDDDGDGWTECDGDCDDGDANVYPGATEICDGEDNDCDGVIDDDPAPVDWYPDDDGDGHGDPAGPTIHACDLQPGHVQPGDDCDDTDATVYPGATEICDGQDNDCDGALSGDELDDDGDGYAECTGDCDDGDATVYPGATEVCDGQDNDCDGSVPAEEADADGDGYTECGGDADCDDTDASVHPGAIEVCNNGVDDDCDGTVDTDAATQDFYPDADHDGYGDELGTPVTDCEPPPGYVGDGTDCDDADYLVHPGMAELPCDGLDNDCDPATVDDEDGDGDGASVCDGDCDDTDAARYPGNTEICDGLDNDCTGGVPSDELDDDGDGFEECGIGGADPDCDDTQPSVYPGAPEVCDGLDNDCDGTTPADEGDGDADGWSVCGGDCDDADDAVHPGATEACNGVDDDCSGAPDADEVDGDGDGVMVCAGDCDDGNSDTFPGATEICDGEDNDCDGGPGLDEVDADSDSWMVCEGDCDDGDASVNPGAAEACDGMDTDCVGGPDADEVDADGDTWMICEGDCDDGDAGINPGETEIPNDGIDQDCDGADAGGALITFVTNRSGDHEVWTMADDGSGQTQVTFDATGAGYMDGAVWPTFSPDGTKIGFAYGHQDHPLTANVYDLGSQQTTELVSSGVLSTFGIGWLDNDRLLYPTASICDSEFRSYDIVQASHALFYSGDPGYPDPLYVQHHPVLDEFVYSSYACGGNDGGILIRKDNGTHVRELLPAGIGIENIRMSPDGSRVAIHTNQPAGCELRVVNWDGTGDSLVLQGNPCPISGTPVAWGPYNQTLLVCADFDDPGNDDIYSLALDGQSWTRLTTDPASDTYPHWTAGPDQDGDGIAFGEGDCDDGDASIYPGATEICDGLADNDCDGDWDGADDDCVVFLDEFDTLDPGWIYSWGRTGNWTIDNGRLEETTTGSPQEGAYIVYDGLDTTNYPNYLNVSADVMYTGITYGSMGLLVMDLGTNAHVNTIALSGYSGDNVSMNCDGSGLPWVPFTHTYDTWYHLEMEFDWSTDLFTTYVDGVPMQDCSLTGVDMADTPYVGLYLGARAQQSFYDDYRVVGW